MIKNIILIIFIIKKINFIFIFELPINRQKLSKYINDKVKIHKKHKIKVFFLKYYIYFLI